MPSCSQRLGKTQSRLDTETNIVVKHERFPLRLHGTFLSEQVNEAASENAGEKSRVRTPGDAPGPGLKTFTCGLQRIKADRLLIQPDVHGVHCVHVRRMTGR